MSKGKTIQEIIEERQQIKADFISGKIKSREAVELLKWNDAAMKARKLAKK